MPLRPLSDAVMFAFICIDLGDGEVTVLMYSGDFTMDALAECFARLIQGEATTLEGSYGVCGKWSGTVPCYMLHRLLFVYPFKGDYNQV